MIKKTAGWNNILNDKLSNNFLSDVNVVNEFSDLENAAPTNPSFIYAAYLKPGHHKFLIYCPVTQRAFYKKIILLDMSSSIILLIIILNFFPLFPTGNFYNNMNSIFLYLPLTIYYSYEKKLFQKKY